MFDLVTSHNHLAPCRRWSERGFHCRRLCARLAVSKKEGSREGGLHRSPPLIERRYPNLNIGNTAGRMLTLKGATLLHVAAEFGQAEVARWLLDVGADVNAPALIDSEGLGGQTPIFHAATQNGNFGIELVRLFLSRGADLNVRCRLPGHYEIPEDKVFEGTVIEYARRFPGTDNQTLEELRRSEHGH